MTVIRITIDAEEAEHLLEWLPGGRELYEHLADVFLVSYYGHDEQFFELTGRHLPERNRR